MKILPSLLTLALLCALITYTSCVNQTSEFRTKEDSLKFAKSIFAKYPDENSVITPYRYEDTSMKKVFKPISWEEVETYKKLYDRKPIIYGPDGVAMKGYFIDSTGYSMIKSNPIIKGLYLRLGRKPDGLFTIMVLGTDRKGNVVRDMMGKEMLPKQPKDSTNFDNTPPCPNDCPLDFDNP